MKKLVITLVSVAFLAGCQTMGPKETGGTLIGAVGGGLVGSAFGSGTGKVVAVGVGAIGGGLLGNYIGKNMDDGDKTHIHTD